MSRIGKALSAAAFGIVIYVASYKLLKSRRRFLPQTCDGPSNNPINPVNPVSSTNSMSPRPMSGEPTSPRPLTAIRRCEVIYLRILSLKNTDATLLPLPNVICRIIAEYATELSLAVVWVHPHDSIHREFSRIDSLEIITNTDELISKALADDVRGTEPQLRQISIAIGGSIYNKTYRKNVRSYQKNSAFFVSTSERGRVTVWGVYSNARITERRWTDDRVDIKHLCLYMSDFDTWAQILPGEVPQQFVSPILACHWSLPEDSFEIKFFAPFCSGWGIMGCKHYDNNLLYVVDLHKVASMALSATLLDNTRNTDFDNDFRNDPTGCWKQIHPKMPWNLLECRHIANEPHLLLHGLDQNFVARIFPQNPPNPPNPPKTAPGYVLNRQQFETILDTGTWPQPIELSNPMLDSIFGDANGICMSGTSTEIRQLYSVLEFRRCRQIEASTMDGSVGPSRQPRRLRIKVDPYKQLVFI